MVVGGGSHVRTAENLPLHQVLVNLLDIRNQADLDAVEGTLVPAKIALWLQAPQATGFDFAHYCALHRYLFEDIYPWAGKPRTVNISKMRTSFCLVADIPTRAQAIFQHLAERNNLQGLNKTDFVAALVDLYERTNELHPFREGNGRTQRTFLAQLAEQVGYQLDFSRVDPDDLMLATIQSATGVNTLLHQLFAELVQPLTTI